MENYICTLEVTGCDYKDRNNMCLADKPGCSFRIKKSEEQPKEKPKKWYEAYIK